MKPLALCLLALTLSAAEKTVDWAKDVIAASQSQPVLVDFHATWCPPCRQLGPVLDEAAKARAGKMILVKIDTDAQGELADAQGVNGIPDVRLFYKGKQVDAFVGYLSAKDVDTFLAPHVK